MPLDRLCKVSPGDDRPERIQEQRTVRHLILIVMVAIAGATPILAADEGDGSNWGTIEQLYVDAAGTVLRINFSRDVVNPSHCEGGGLCPGTGRQPGQRPVCEDGRRRPARRPLRDTTTGPTGRLG